MTDAAEAPTNIDDLRLFIRYDEGQGPIIVMLHGINSDAQDWRPVIDTIGPRYRCIAPDVLGFGESPKPRDIDYSSDEHALVLHNTLRDLGIDEQFVLVGYSLGGDIAVRFASTYPEQLRRLFLLSTPFYLPAQDYSRRRFSSQILQAMIMRGLWGFVARGERDNTPVYQLASGRLESFSKQFLRTDDVPKHWDIMAKNLVNCISAATLIDDLPKLDMPTVFAMGVRDPIVRPDQTPALQRIKPDLEVRRIQGLTADHFMLVALPERVAQEIVRDEIKALNVARRRGQGEPIAILAGPEGADPWRPIADALAPRFDVAVIDLLGFGRSPAPLSAHYDLTDHVSAVRATVRALWPGPVKVHVVGYQLGATVALGMAGFAAEKTASALAFSPATLLPGHDAEESVRSQQAAAALAARNEIAEMGRDEQARGVAGEALERRIVPLVKSIDNTVLRTDPAPLVARATVPVRLVLPTGDSDAPREWARTLAVAGRIELSEPDGPRELPLEQPGVAVAEIAPELAGRMGRLEPAKRRGGAGTILNDWVRAVDRRFILRGLGSLALGIVLLLRITAPSILIARGFAIWIAFSAVTTVIGAFGLRREGKSGWVPWVLIGVVGAALAVFMLLDQTLAVRLFGLFVFVYVLYRAGADLFVASRVSDTPGPKWALWLRGLAALAVAVVAVISPQAGARLLRVVLGVYFVSTGLALLTYGIQSWRRASRRVRDLLGA